MTDTGPPAPSVSRRRWPRVLLIASLALNALLIGVILRGLWIARSNFAAGGFALETALPAFVSTLPEPRREELRRASLPERPGELRPLRIEIRRARADVARAFLADPFDKPAFLAAQSRLNEAEIRLRTTVQQIMPELGERLTAQERRAYLNWRGHGWDRERRGGRPYRDREEGEERGQRR